MKYEVALSFPGENRTYVEEVANELVRLGIKVFYDNFETADLWGKDLYQHLNDVYKNKSKYVVTFLDKNYSKKKWTNHELKAAQDKAFTLKREYILPVYFETIIVAGINSTVGRIDGNNYTAIELAQLIKEKVS